ncbi:MAG: class I SAM-dependent methyltransferase [Candidatus Lokiarchaeota archaeon]|nr:class I SAM-dependent methyltransferase [Candidatus Lokiarchaeota archaeon]
MRNYPFNTLKGNLLNNYQKIIAFCDLLSLEISQSEKLYGETHGKQLKKYYSFLLGKRGYSCYRQHYYAERAKFFAQNAHPKKQVLDAGCGMGSEAILMSILGCRVIGVDTSKERVSIAQERLLFYENYLNINLDLEFYEKNILKHTGEYDLIILNEAVSHIAPLGDLVLKMRKLLKKGGNIIIAETNKLNPYISFLSKRAQKKKGGVFIIKTDPRTNKNFNYAVERIFSAPEILKLLSKYFAVKFIYNLGYFPFFIFRINPKICILVENLFRKIPFLEFLSGAYVIIFTKS